MFEEGTAAVIWLLLANVVAKAVPFHTTTELLRKFPPFTVRVNPSPPTVALFGEIEVTEGVGGQPPQEARGSSRIANARQSADLFIIAVASIFKSFSVGGKARE
jgi:hypothetical protein